MREAINNWLQIGDQAVLRVTTRDVTETVKMLKPGKYDGNFNFYSDHITFLVQIACDVDKLSLIACSFSW